MDHVMTGITPFAMPQDGKFHYPTDKKRTKQTTETMIAAEKHLDLFWSKFDMNWKKIAKKSIDASMGHHIPSHRGQQLERTAPWVEPIQEKSQKQKVEQKAGKESKEWVDTMSSAENKIPVNIKRKLKTKGVGQPVVETSTQQTRAHEAPGQQTDKQPSFKVDKSALKVFNTLFYTPGQTDQPGEIPWRDFLHAMARTGFVPQKLYGSIWQFTPTKLDVERSIQFHEPHPSVKIRFTVARRMGRRLTRAYGWGSGMFELE